MNNDKAFSVLATEYSSIARVGGRARIMETVHTVIRMEYGAGLPSSCDCRKDFVAGLANRWGRGLSTIDRAISVLSSSATELS